MSSVKFEVAGSSVCRYVVVVAHKQFLDLLTLFSGNCDMCDVFGAKTSNVCLRRLVASVNTLLLDGVDDYLKVVVVVDRRWPIERNTSSCLLQAV